MIQVLRVITFTLGALLVLFTLLSPLRTLILPRAAPDIITDNLFRIVRWIFDILLGRARVYVTRDRIMAFYAPIALFTLLPVWLILVTLSYTGMY